MEDIYNKIIRKKWFLITRFFYKTQFGGIGNNSIIFKPLQLKNVKSIFIESNVDIYHHAWIMCLSRKNSTIRISDGTNIGHFSHIISFRSVTIERNVLIADKVFISDCTHQYNDIDVPIIRQDVKALSPVIIGEGSWIGENVSICGASIGKHCVIGANSVVISDIPDYCIAVGSPAKIVKKYDFDKKEWLKI